ncbi:MAG: hypothetical protein Q9212_002595 [Teloschistes hypoglaucus]
MACTMHAEPVSSLPQPGSHNRLTCSRITAVFTAAVVFLIWVLCNVFEPEIREFFAEPNRIPQLVRRSQVTGPLNPFGDPTTVAQLIAEPEKARSDDIIRALPQILPPPPAPAPEPETTTSTVPSSAEPEPTTSTLPPPPEPEPTTSTVPPPAEPEPTTSSSPKGTIPPNFPFPTPPPPIPDWTADVPHSPGKDEYHHYTGNGSVFAGWPKKADWMSYEDMFTINLPLIKNSCTIYHVPLNTPLETQAIHNATRLIAIETNLDPRFILAVILQESSGCVRVPTSYYAVRNPGLMQDHDGPATCNEDAAPVYPCPYTAIEEMIREGSAGTTDAMGTPQMGLVEAWREAVGRLDGASRWYRASRIYNSGSVDPSGDLGMGVATHCYASDVANRLTGWTLAEDRCDGAGRRGRTGVRMWRSERVGLMGVGGKRRDGKRAGTPKNPQIHGSRARAWFVDGPDFRTQTNIRIGMGRLSYRRSPGDQWIDIAESYRKRFGYHGFSTTAYAHVGARRLRNLFQNGKLNFENRSVCLISEYKKKVVLPNGAKPQIEFNRFVSIRFHCQEAPTCSSRTEYLSGDEPSAIKVEGQEKVKPSVPTPEAFPLALLVDNAANALAGCEIRLGFRRFKCKSKNLPDTWMLSERPAPQEERPEESAIRDRAPEDRHTKCKREEGEDALTTQSRTATFGQTSNAIYARRKTYLDALESLHLRQKALEEELRDVRREKGELLYLIDSGCRRRVG